MFGDFYHLALFVISSYFLQFSQECCGILQLSAKRITRNISDVNLVWPLNQT